MEDKNKKVNRKGCYKNTTLCCYLKTVLQNDRVMKAGKDYQGMLRRDVETDEFLFDEHYTFVETLPATAGKRNPHVYDGKYITITHRDDGSLRPNFIRRSLRRIVLRSQPRTVLLCRISSTLREPYCTSDSTRELLFFVIFALGSYCCPRQWGKNTCLCKRFNKNRLHGLQINIKKAGTPCVSKEFRLKILSKIICSRLHNRLHK